MIIVPYFNDPESGERAHPWEATGYGDEKNRGGRYVDFKLFPELIPETLEDFKPHSSLRAVQHFYAFLAWINGPGALLETNDCALRGPAESPDTIFRKNLRIDGRVELFARKYEWNVGPDSFWWLQKMLFIYLELDRSNFRNGSLSMSSKETIYLALRTEANRGKRISIIFNAYGNDNSEVFENLFTVFDVIWESCKRLNVAMQVPVPELPP